MSQLEEIASGLSLLLQNLKCDFAEIRLTQGVGQSISLAMDQVDSISSGEVVGGSVRVLKNGSWGFVTFNDLSNIESFVKSAMDCASLSPSGKSGVAKYSASVKNFSTPFVEDLKSISFEEKFEIISKYNDIIKNSPKIQTTKSIYRESTGKYIYLNSEGTQLSYDRMHCGISLTAVAKDGTIIQPLHDSISGYGGFEIVRHREAMAERVIKIAIDMLEAEPLAGGVYNIIADPRLSGVFIHEAFGHLSEADFVYENESMRKQMVLGREFALPDFTVVDDGGIESLSGYIPFDDEGIAPQKTYLIKNGILTGRLHSRETAFKMNEETTGNGRAIGVMRQPIVRMTNTYIENGPYQKDDLFAAMDDGIYALDVIGGQTNLEMFTFTAGYGYRVKNGKLGKMFRDVVLSGNVFTTLKNISMIANDRQMFGGLGGCGKGGQSPLPVSYGGPHVFIKDVLIGGKQ